MYLHPQKFTKTSDLNHFFTIYVSSQVITMHYIYIIHKLLLYTLNELYTLLWFTLASPLYKGVRLANIVKQCYCSQRIMPIDVLLLVTDI